jgi:hypothetical protein
MHTLAILCKKTGLRIRSTRSYTSPIENLVEEKKRAKHLADSEKTITFATAFVGEESQATDASAFG